jgi:predicted transposase YdaD
MTLADRFRQEGRHEGHQEGLQKGLQKGLYEGEVLSRRQALLEVLEVRFGSVPEGLGETLAAVSDLDRLKALHRTALTVPDLEAFASGL